MSYSIKRLPEVPVVINTWYPDFDPATELETNVFEAKGLLEQQPEPVAYVANLIDVKLDFQELVLILAEFARGADAIYHHANVREVIVATNDKPVHLATQGLDSEVYGFLKVHIFNTLDDALDYAYKI